MENLINIYSFGCIITFIIVTVYWDEEFLLALVIALFWPLIVIVLIALEIKQAIRIVERF